MKHLVQSLLKKGWPAMVLILVLSLWLGMRYFGVDHERARFPETFENRASSEESCFSCHSGIKGFSRFHSPELIGCVSCHLGDPGAFEKMEAHKNMVLIPGNLSDAALTCGTCHPNELDKIEHSLMTSNSGLVAVDKYIFGETDSPNHHFDIRELGHSPADEHLRNLCANCHLGATKNELGPITQLSRGGGCNACHLNYTEEASSQLDAYLLSGKTKLPVMHPSADIYVTDNHCFGCHSRSSRISTGYMGWSETLLDDLPEKDQEGYKVFEDKRIYRYEGEDVHHSKGLLCIDCHSSHEVMGDGKEYLHEESAVKLTCSDCHYKESPLTVAHEELDAESQLVFMHRNYQHHDKRILAVKEDGHPLVNTYQDEKGLVYLIGKKDGRKHLVKKQSEVCSRDESHQSLSCSACHAQWAPRCIGCHNSFEQGQMGYDLLDKKMIEDTWMEHVFEFGAALPAMGVRVGPEENKIEPAIPGMILTIDHSNRKDSLIKDTTFERLYAPNAPHTTSRTVRNCASCHTNPAALGYGKGSLSYVMNSTSGTWVFEPEYAINPSDGLPEDAWIPFLKESKALKLSTRTDFRPFNLAEQQLILTVGSCLQCHEEDSKMMRESLKTGINPLLLKLTEQCLLPEF